MAGYGLFDQAPDQRPGLLDGISPMLLAAGGALLGGQGWGGAVQGGLQAQQAQRQDMLRRMMLQHNLQRDERDFGFRQTEAQRAQGNADRTFGLQEQQVEMGRVPPGWQRTPDGKLAIIPNGPADPDYLAKAAGAKKPAFEDEQKLRKEFAGASEPYLGVRRAYERVLASRDDAAGDLSLIFGFMRMLDPTSTVREGEAASAQNAAGIPEQVRNMYNRALTGERLSPDQRNRFKGQAGDLYKAAEGEYTSRSEQFRGIAGRYGIDPSRIIPSLGPAPRATPQAGTTQLNLPPLPPGFNVVR